MSKFIPFSKIVAETVQQQKRENFVKEQTRLIKIELGHGTYYLTKQQWEIYKKELDQQTKEGIEAVISAHSPQDP